MQPIHANFKPSMQFIVLFISAGILALVLLIWLVFTGPVFLQLIVWPLSLLITLATVYTTCHHGMLILPWSCVGLQIKADGLLVNQHDGRLFKATILPTTTVTAYLTIIHLKRAEDIAFSLHQPLSKLPKSAQSVVRYLFFRHDYILVLPDKFCGRTSVAAQNSYRQLRVWLRCAAIESNRPNRHDQ